MYKCAREKMNETSYNRSNWSRELVIQTRNNTTSSPLFIRLALKVNQKFVKSCLTEKHEVIGPKAKGI